jgi:plasmid stabilization system protein ParE
VRIDFHPDATHELSEGADWYLEQSPSAAQHFAMAVERTLEKIASDPSRFAIVGKGTRACSVERFPFQIVFRSEPRRLYVIAVAHAKRRPGYWRNRK